MLQQLFLKGFNDMVTTNTAADEVTSVPAATDHCLAPGHTAHPHVLEPTHSPATCMIQKKTVNHITETMLGYFRSPFALRVRLTLTMFNSCTLCPEHL